MTTTGPTPEDLETIAAFVDQRLSAEEREAFVQRLDAEEALYEVFVETVRSREEAAAEPAEIIDHPASRRAWGWGAAIAAVLAVAVAVPVWLVNRGEVSYGEMLVADGGLEGQLGEGWFEQEWPENRGIIPGSREEDRAFRLGVRVVDLEVALLSRRRSDAMSLIGRSEALLGAMNYSGPSSATYSQLRRDLTAGRPGEELLDSMASVKRLAKGWPLDLARAFELGRWTEAGRLAARSGNVRLLTSRSFRRSLSQLAAGDWGPEVEDGLDRVAVLLDAPGGLLDLPSLDEVFASIIREG